MGRNPGGAAPNRRSAPGFISGSESGAVEGTTTYTQSYPHGGANPTSRPFPGPGGGPMLVASDDPSAGRKGSEYVGKNDVTGTLATKRSFPERIYHPSYVVVPKGSAVDPDFTTDYCALGQSPAVEGPHKNPSAGRPLDYFTSGGILAFTNTGKPLNDRNPPKGSGDYDKGQIILPDGTKPDFSSDYIGSIGTKMKDDDVKKALSARCAGKSHRDGAIALAGAKPLAGKDVRAQEGKKLQTCLAPDGKVFYDTSTNKGEMAGDQAVRKSCTRAVQKPRNSDVFELRVAQENKWRKQFHRNTASKTGSTVSTLAAGFKSSRFEERAQRATTYGPRCQPLFEDDVKIGRRLPEDILVPDQDAAAGFVSEAQREYVDLRKRNASIRATRAAGTTEASCASVFSGAGSKAGSRVPVPVTEASHASGFSAAMKPLDVGGLHGSQAPLDVGAC